MTNEDKPRCDACGGRIIVTLIDGRSLGRICADCRKPVGPTAAQLKRQLQQARMRGFTEGNGR